MEKFYQLFQESILFFQNDKTGNPRADWMPLSLLIQNKSETRKIIEEDQKKFFAPWYTVNTFFTDTEIIDQNLIIYKEQRKTDKLPSTPRFKENLKSLQAFFIDLDVRKEGETSDIEEKKLRAFDAILQMNLPPTFTNETKNGFQLLWRIEDVVRPSEDIVSRYTKVEEALIEWSKTIGGIGDKVKDVARVLRLPGFYHLKDPNNPFLVQCFETGQEYQFEDIERHFLQFYVEKPSPVTIYQPSNSDSYNIADEINQKVDIRDLVPKAFQSVGVSFEEDSQSRWILNGRLTGNFYSKEGKNIACTTSGSEPFSGPPFAVAFQIFKHFAGNTLETKRQCFEFLNHHWGNSLRKQSYEIKKIQTEQGTQQQKKHENLDRFQLQRDGLIEDIFSRRYENYYSWGMPEVDQEGGLLTLGRIAIIGGSHGSGKSTYVTELAKVNSQSKKTMLIPLEMGSEYTMMMLACNLFNREREDMKYLKYGEVEEGYLYLRPQREQDFYKECIQKIYDQYPNFSIGVPPDLSFEALRLFITEKYEKEGIKFFVIDHLHQLDTSTVKDENEVKFFSDVAKGLKELASSLQIALLCVVQLTKYANSADSIIDLSSFKGTSEFTSNAHRVVAIQRPSYKISKGQIKKELAKMSGAKPPEEEVDAEELARRKQFEEMTRHVRELHFLKTRGRDNCVVTIHMDRGYFEFSWRGSWHERDLYQSS